MDLDDEARGGVMLIWFPSMTIRWSAVSDVTSWRARGEVWWVPNDPWGW